jgi:hypothetical protein
MVSRLTDSDTNYQIHDSYPSVKTGCRLCLGLRKRESQEDADKCTGKSFMVGTFHLNF